MQSRSSSIFYPEHRMITHALDVASAWLRVRETELSLMAQQDETWREMVREGIFRAANSTRAERAPFSDIWVPRVRRGQGQPPRGRRARTVTRTGPVPGQTANWLSEWTSPVPVLATQAQIDSATEELTFSSVHAPLNDRCPITQQLFQPNDRVARITPCGHLCEINALRRWFTYSVRCPVCRLDIRDVAANATTPAPDTPQPITGPVDNSTTIPTPGAPANPTEDDFARFASRVATELADQLLRDAPTGAANLTFEYAVLGQPEGREDGGAPVGERDST